ncbi:anaphase-promoting complex subunit 15B-like [Hydractinia symbiolongicarpus]|uniref:anaphase-promoting complex subunit 15B-like n=1 Tax=Hydractinia symbiolongicarpus TaxID=13093 RepID=UPI00254B9FB0|nr:anaphase-promoting complex subunit 15B-like [Hydractinia symbiolongicarpus]
MSFFPSLLPKISNELWFNVESNTTVPDESELVKEETKYKEEMEAVIKDGEDIVPYGKTKEASDNAGEDEDEIEDDDSNEEIDEDTDEFDTASNGLDSIEDDMLNASGMNETNDGW